MAALMIVGITTTLVIREPEVGTRQTDAFRSNADYLRFMSVFIMAIGTFIIGFFLSKGLGQMYRTILIDNFGVMHRLASFLTETARLAFSVMLGALVAWLLIRVRVVTYDHVRETYVDPIADFFRRYGTMTLVIIALIGTYRISDILMGVIANVFYLDVGFTKSQIATYTKFWGLWATIGGGFIGGVLSVRYGVIRTLFLGALLSAATNVLFAYVSRQGPDEMLLLMVIVADNGSAGIAAAAFVAYLSSLTSVSFTAMQYAVFSSIMTLFPKILAGYSGGVVDSVGYEMFFIGTAIVGIPVLFLIVLAGRLDTVNDS
jgi:PAT family beta-lactamase induction signal transducer AmpG